MSKHLIRTLKFPVEVETARYWWYNGLQRKGVNIVKFKFVVTCKKCGCRTELSSGEWTSHNRFQCQNCKTVMDGAQFSSIRDAASYISVALDRSNEFYVEIESNAVNSFDK